MSDYSDLILTSSPVGYWRLNETSGTTATDLSGGAYHGTYTGGFTLDQPGLIDQDATSKSVGLDGADGRIPLVAGVPAAVHGSSAATVEAWINADAIPSTGGVIALSTGTNDGCVINVLSPTTLSFGGRSVAADAFQGETVAVASQVGKTAHLVTVCDYANDKIYGYLNGVKVVDKVVTFANVTFTYAVDLYYGNIGTGSTAANFLDGRIGDVAIYPTALSGPTILSHYEAGPAQPESRQRIKTTIQGYYSIHHLGI